MWNGKLVDGRKVFCARTVHGQDATRVRTHTLHMMHATATMEFSWRRVSCREDERRLLTGFLKGAVKLRFGGGLI
jgi:hypothetical protein